MKIFWQPEFRSDGNQEETRNETFVLWIGKKKICRMDSFGCIRALFYGPLFNMLLSLQGNMNILM